MSEGKKVTRMPWQKPKKAIGRGALVSKEGPQLEKPKGTRRDGFLGQDRGMTVCSNETLADSLSAAERFAESENGVILPYTELVLGWPYETEAHELISGTQEYVIRGRFQGEYDTYVVTVHWGKGWEGYDRGNILNSDALERIQRHPKNLPLEKVVIPDFYKEKFAEGENWEAHSGENWSRDQPIRDPRHWFIFESDKEQRAFYEGQHTRDERVEVKDEFDRISNLLGSDDRFLEQWNGIMAYLRGGMPYIDGSKIETRDFDFREFLETGRIPRDYVKLFSLDELEEGKHEGHLKNMRTWGAVVPLRDRQEGTASNARALTLAWFGNEERAQYVFEKAKAMGRPISKIRNHYGHLRGLKLTSGETLQRAMFRPECGYLRISPDLNESPFKQPQADLKGVGNFVVARR